MSNEAKTTKAYKISPELKEKLERLAAESGLDTQEAFIEQLAALYELQLLKEGNGSGYAKQIDELEYHTRRSVELFVGMINTEAAERLQQSQQHDVTLSERAATIYGQEQEIAEQRKEAKAQADELVRIAKENEQQGKLVEQLQESLRDKSLIVEQRGQEIATLSGIVNEYKAAAEENKELKTKISEFTILTDKQATRVATLESDLVALEKLKIEQQHQAETRHTEALNLLSKQKDVERKEALADIREKQQDKLEQANEDIRKLYADIENIRKDHEQQIRDIQQKNGDGQAPPAPNK
ncbi:MAG: hypothetical protein ACE3L7_32155 [Candidatus Pristimantibacillus sp.]